MSIFTREFILSLSKIVDPITGCWLYQGYCLRGYGVACINGKDYYISRLAMIVYNNLDYNDPKEACHKPICPNTECFNPDHLYPGTHGDNMRDKIITKTHHQHKKEVCPKCGGNYRIHKVRTGWNKGRIFRECLNCITVRNKVRSTKAG